MMQLSEPAVVFV